VNWICFLRWNTLYSLKCINCKSSVNPLSPKIIINILVTGLRRDYWLLIGRTWALTIWMDLSVEFLGQMELHFFSPRNRNGLSRIIWFEVSEECFPAPFSSKARIMKEKVKHEYWRPKLKSFSPWVLQLCCKKSVNSSYMYKNKTAVTSGMVWNSKDSSLESAVLGIAVFSEIQCSLALVIVDKWYRNFREFQ